MFWEKLRKLKEVIGRRLLTILERLWFGKGCITLLEGVWFLSRTDLRRCSPERLVGMYYCFKRTKSRKRVKGRITLEVKKAAAAEKHMLLVHC